MESMFSYLIEIAHVDGWKSVLQMLVQSFILTELEEIYLSLLVRHFFEIVHP